MSTHSKMLHLGSVVALTASATLAIGAYRSVGLPERRPDHEDRHLKNRELWVTHQRDSAVSIFSFPEGKLLKEFSLPDDTRPHITTFHSGAYAYISGMGNGTLSIVDANSRDLVQTLTFAPTLCHQGKVSPDGTIMLVSVVSTHTLYKVAVVRLDLPVRDAGILAGLATTPDGAQTKSGGHQPFLRVDRADDVTHRFFFAGQYSKNPVRRNRNLNVVLRNASQHSKDLCRRDLSA